VRSKFSAAPPGLKLFLDFKPAVKTAGYYRPRRWRWAQKDFASAFQQRGQVQFPREHRQFAPGFPLAAGKVWCHLVVMSNAQLLARITMDADICHGKPCIRGLRYPVEWLLELLSGDMTEPQILADYPDLEAADLRAAIAYAARLSRIKSIEPVAA
jgi:uncharacterized protein (DUF433 family)